MKTKPRSALAATINQDLSELEDMRYKPTRTSCAIYADDSHYYAARKTAPKDEVGGPWRKHADQFWAEKAGTVIWVCDVSSD
jgi:hypothetical protein